MQECIDMSSLSLTKNAWCKFENAPFVFAVVWEGKTIRNRGQKSLLKSLISGRIVVRVKAHNFAKERRRISRVDVKRVSV